MESYPNSTYLIVGGFLVITLLMGLYAGRGIKDFKEYALGKGNFSTFTLTLTLLATHIGGGSTIGAVNKVYSIGIIFIVACLGHSIQHLFFAYVISPRIIRFKNCITIGDIMEQLFNRKIKFLTGIFTFLYSFFLVVIQFYMIGKIFHYLGVDIYVGIILGGIIISVYSALGGIKAVTFTDVMQFVILIIVIPMIAMTVLKNVGGYKILFQNLPKSRLDLFSSKDYYYYLTYFLTASFIPRRLTSPAIMQRVFMCSSKQQIKNKFLTAAFIDPVLRIIILIIGLCAVILYPNANPKHVLFDVIDHIFQTPIMKGIAITGLLSIVMSTGDSLIHSAGLVMSNDIINNLFESKNKNIEIFTAKLMTLVTGFLGILLALKMVSGLGFININLWTVLSTGPTILFPLLLGILGLKTDKNSFYISFITGVLVFLLSRVFLPVQMKILAAPLGILSNGITFLFSHIFQNGGIVWIKHESKKKNEEKWTPRLEGTMNFIAKYIPTPGKLFSYSKESVMKYGANNILFGLYCCINFSFPYLLWDHKDPLTFDFLTNLRFIGGIMAGLLIVRSEWKDIFKPYFHLFWHLTLCYCLPFITTLMVLLSNGSVEWMVNVAVSIFFLILLTSGGMFLILLPTGIAAGLWVYKLKFGPINFASYGFDFNYNLFYVFFFSTIIALLFAYRKRLFYLIRGNQGMNLGGALAHELKNCGFQALPTAQLVSQYASMGGKETEIEGKKGVFIENEIYKKIKDFANQTAHHMQQTIDISKGFESIFEEFKDSIANPMVISAQLVAKKAIKDYVFADEKQRKGVQLKLENDFFAKIPKEAFSYVLTNIIRNAYKHGKATQIKIWLDNHEIHIWDNGIGIAPEHLSKLFDLYYTTGDTKSTGRGLAFCKQIVDSCYGEISVDTECEGEDTYTEFTIKLPSVSSSEIDEVNLKDSVNEGISKGIDLKASQIAESMLRKSEPVDKIKEYTGLSGAEIQDIQRKIDK